MPSRPNQVDYPPTDGGLPLSTVDELMDGQAALIARIRMHAATEPEIFEARYLTPMRNLAGYILNLPATQDDVYGGPGGLFRASIELAFLCFQAADGRIFTGLLGVEDRYKLETRWRYVCFGSGLLWPVGRTLETVRVQFNGANWPARVQGLDAWGKEVQADRVFLTWPRGDFEPGPSVNASVLTVRVLGDKAVEWLEQGSPRMMTALIEVAAGMTNEHNSIAFEVLTSMWEKALVMERARMPGNYGRVKFGQHMAPHIIDSMRLLCEKGKWKVNESPVHVDGTGVYLVWPEAAEHLVEMMRSQGIVQTPQTPEGMMTLLIDEAILKVDDIGGVYVDIANDAGEIMSAVRLLKPNMLIADYDPSSYGKARTVAMKEILKEDPITQAAIKAAATTQESSAKEPDQPRRAPPPAPDPLEATLGLTAIPAPVRESGAAATLELPAIRPPVQETTEQADGAVLTLPAPSDPASKSTSSTKQDAVAAPSGTTPHYGPKALEEKNNAGSFAVTYKDVLPPYVIKSINNGLVCEQLARLVAKMKAPEKREKLIFADDYVAVPWEFFEGTVLAPPNFLTTLGDAGFLHFNPTARGKKIHEIPAAPGSKTKIKCFLLARTLTNRLGMTQK